jgi:hypothetical protein
LSTRSDVAKIRVPFSWTAFHLVWSLWLCVSALLVLAGVFTADLKNLEAMVFVTLAMILQRVTPISRNEED